MCESGDASERDKLEAEEEVAGMEMIETTEAENKEDTERKALEAAGKEILEATEKDVLEATEKETLEDTVKEALGATEKNVLAATEKEALEATEIEAMEAKEDDVFEAIENEIIDQEKTCDKISVRQPKFSKSDVGSVFHCQEPECPMVKTAFESKYSIRVHFYDNHLREEEKIFVCEYCHTRFALRTMLNKHVKLAHEKRHVCPHCGHREPIQ